MKSHSEKALSAISTRGVEKFFRGFLLAACVWALAPGAQATIGNNWLGTGGTPSNWNETDNWSQSVIPDGGSVASFGLASQTSVGLSASVSLNGIFFSGPTLYTLTNGATLDLSGTGLSGAAGQTLVNNGTINFYNGTADNAVITNNANLFFRNTATAGSATITNNNFTEFVGSSTAGSASITNASVLYFLNSTSAGSANITNNGTMEFFNSSTVGSATLTTNSGDIVYFTETADGGTGRFIVNSGGAFDISNDQNVSVTVGSIEGAGTFYLGNHNLITGSNNLNTTVSGLITDGGDAGGTASYLTKIGTGTLFLSGNNTYTEGTNLNAGTLGLGNNGALGTGSLFMEDGTTLQAGLDGLSVSNYIGLVGTDNFDSNGLAWTLSGTIGGTGGLKVISSVNGGALTLTGSNSYEGSTEIDGGVLNFDSNNNFGTSGLMTLDGGTLQAGANFLLFSQAITLGDNGGTYDTNGNLSANVYGSVNGTGDFSVVGGGFFGLFGGFGGNSGNAVTLSCGNLNITDVAFVEGADDGTLDGGAGGNAVLNATGLVSVDPSAVSIVGGNGTDNDSGDGGDGGSAAVTVGSFNMTGGSTYDVVGGYSGGYTGSTAGNLSGKGGDASFVSSGAVSVDSSQLGIVGGQAVSGLGTADQTEGSGGNAAVSVGSLFLTNGDSTSTALNILAGAGASDDITSTGIGLAQGGNGGTASLISAGAVSMDSSLLGVTGGAGGYSDSNNGGDGGNAWMTVNDQLTMTSGNSLAQLYVTGGQSGKNNYDLAVGVAGNGGSAGLTVSGAVSMDSSLIAVNGGAATFGFGAIGQTEGSGGSALVSIGSLTMTNGQNTTSGVSIMGGAGGADDLNDTPSAGSNYGYGNGGNGGDGGLLSSGAVSMDSAWVTVAGGAGGYSDSGNGGNGGKAWVTLGGDLVLTSNNNYSALGITGGQGGAAYYGNGTGGSGGDAGLSALSLSADSSVVNVIGGGGQYGESDGTTVEGSGGSASVSLGSLTLVSDNYNINDNGNTSYLALQGGQAANEDDLGVGGNGGAAGLTVSGAVSVDSSYVTLAGGNATGGYGLAGQTESSGGSVTASLGSLTLTSDGYWQNDENSQDASFGLQGGTGGSDSSLGIGGSGGNAMLSVTGPLSMDSSGLKLYGGNGGGSDSANGGTGGNAVLSLSSGLTVTSNSDTSSLYLYGGNGGSNAGDAAGVAGDSGAGMLSVAGAVSVDSSYVYVAGGSADYGYGSAAMTEGSGGNAWVSMGSLSLSSENYYDGSGDGDKGSFEMGGGNGPSDYNLGLGGKGGSVTFLSSGVSVDSAEINLYGGNGGSSAGGNGGDGGSAFASMTDLTVTSAYSEGYFFLTGGQGGGNTSLEGPGFSGKGGAATLLVSGAVSMDSSRVEVDGGGGSIGYGSAGTTEAVGGSAWATVGSLTLNSDNYVNNNIGYVSAFEVDGSTGASDGDLGIGGKGGDAYLTLGSAGVTDSSIVVFGGDGRSSHNVGTGLGLFPAGGDSNLTDVAGNGSDSVTSLTGSIGGNASIMASSISLVSPYYVSTLYDEGGFGGAGGSAGNGGVVVSGQLETNGSFTGGNGGNSDMSGGGGQGGNASATILSLAADNSDLYLEGRTGGTGGQAGSGGLVSMDSYVFNSMATGGNGGSNDVGGAGGNGGNLAAAVSFLSITDWTYGEFYGGDGGVGGRAGNGGAASSHNGSTLITDQGGNGGDDNLGGVGGVGGNMGLTVVSADLTDHAHAYWEGGTGGNGGDAGTGGVAYDASNSSAPGDICDQVTLLGGNGGNNNIGGAGGLGGNAVVAMGAVSIDNAVIYVEGGTGGNGGLAGTGGSSFLGDNTTNGTTTNGSDGTGNHNGIGGIGGNASLTINSLVLNNNGELDLFGGYGGNGSVNGIGGNAYGSIGSLTLVDTGSTFYFGGGVGSTDGSAQVTIGSLTGIGTISGYNNSRLQVQSGDFGGSLQGTELLEKTGAGALTLTGDNTYYGGTSILGGTLAVGNSDALGAGDVALYGGTLMSSDGPSTIYANSNYSQGGTGTLQLGIASAVSGDWDVLSVGGTTSLGGTLKLVSYGGFVPSAGQTFQVVAASGPMSGTFGTLMDDFFRPLSVTYLGHDVTVTMLTFSQVGDGSANQTAMGAALDSLVGSDNVALSELLTSTPASDWPKAFNLLSPAGLTPLYQMGFSLSQAQADIVDQYLAGLWDSPGFASKDYSWKNQGTLFAANLPASQEAGMANAAQPDRFNVFVNGLGHLGAVTGDANAAGYQYSLAGTTAGMDYRFSENFTAGLLLGYSSSGTSQSSSSVKATGGQIGLFGGYKADALHLEALVSGGLNSYTTQRTALGGMATGTAQGTQFSGLLGAGLDFNMDKAKVGPFAKGLLTSVSINAFNESGSLLPYNYGAQSESSFTTDFGVQGTRNYDLGGGFILSPTLSAAWEHVYQGNLDAFSANFGSSASAFTVNGPKMGTDGLALGVGLNALFAQGLNGYVQYQGKLGITNYDSQSLVAGMSLGF